ncbi:MAG TPA: pilus assembly protein TadG-related protein [Sphingopyxis sp.]|uniref:pilus assembly protein TadG-related protein n=1 Tax=Sphingopyxis sp. TaxID=1908224 RepID=UPI002E307E9B|nr:pilus assembly protein TadG-related protein [Sphingopyxis sp.]HEX2812485.1 pilus assembly protein TadG-related protein [Sphingopyxis sp.]
MTRIFPSRRPAAALARFLARLKGDQKGGVYLILGFALIPLTFIVGFGVDYARAMSLQTRLNAAADAAALAAVAPSMILESNSVSTAAATKMFNSQAAELSGYRDLQMTPVITDGTSGSSGALGYLRQATVSYSAKSINMFAGLLGADTLTVSGTASASAAQPPNVDFYLAMDNSPSMLLPATSDGVSKIIEATKSSAKPNGCAFACHMQMSHSDGIYIKDAQSRDVLLSTGYYTSGSGKQNVWYRWDATAKALYDSSGNPMNTATTTVSGPNTTTTTAGPTTETTTSGKGSNKVTTTTTTTTRTDTERTVTTAVVVTYSIVDNTNGPVTIKKTTVSTPTTKEKKTVTTTVVTKVGNNNPTTKTTTSGPAESESTGTASSSNETYDTGFWADGYWLTHNYGSIYSSGPSSIVLRKDEVVSAASQLIPFAANQAAQYHVTYRAQMFSFDWARSSNSTPVKELNSLTNVSSYSSGFSAASVFPLDDYWWKNSMPSSSTNNDDKATDVAGMLTAMNDIIPNAGTGAPGAVPQKILFIITDGMLDQPSGGGRYFGPMATSDIAKCTTIKARGIKIAVLYTQYLPETLVGDSWSQDNIAKFLPAPPSPYSKGKAGDSDQVLTALQKCASVGTNGLPLVQTVTADDNITTALQQLFSTALQTARLVQ